MLGNIISNSTYKVLKFMRKHSEVLWKQHRKYSYQRSKINESLVTPLFLKAKDHKDKCAIVDKYGTHTYDTIHLHTQALTSNIFQKFGVEKQQDINKERVCFLCGNDVSYVVTQWAVWMSGGIAVPLCTSHPASQLQYFIEDSQSKLLVFTEEYREKVAELSNNIEISTLMLSSKDLFAFDKKINESDDDDKIINGSDKYSQDQEALIIYTSGTTGKPKGVVHTFGSLNAQMQAMIESWKWSAEDVVLHVLPLHHVHGIVNVLMTPLYVGATCVMLPKFDAEKVWELLTGSPDCELSEGITVSQTINMFMAVPTIYKKLLDFLAKKKFDVNPITSQIIKHRCSKNIRLMVSGSSALSEPIMSKWKEVTGHMLLERYGMTEIGMALTNSLDGERIPGAVGRPFPSVEVCIGRRNITSDNGYYTLAAGNHEETVVTTGEEEEQGELLVKGPSLFKGYWNKPVETEDSFTSDGWFKTGDTACYMDGNYYIKGRTSVDIIKSGGFKISALEIEGHLINHPVIFDIAVVGLPDITWGQKVAVVAELHDGENLTLIQLQEYCSDKMPHYQIPSVLKVLDNIPRNQMGKVNKKQLLLEVFGVK